MKIKSFNIADIEEITRLFISVFSSPPWNENWEFSLAKKRLTDIYNTPGFFGIIYSDEKINGFVMGHIEQFQKGKEFFLQEFCVDNKFQGQGFGRILFEHLTNELYKRDIDVIYLITLKNSNAYEFYLKNGFECSTEVVVMGKHL